MSGLPGAYARPRGHENATACRVPNDHGRRCNDANGRGLGMETLKWWDIPPPVGKVISFHGPVIGGPLPRQGTPRLISDSWPVALFGLCCSASTPTTPLRSPQRG